MPNPLDSIQTDASYKLFFEQHPVPALLIDGDTFAIKALNKAFSKRYGHTENSLLLKPFDSICTNGQQALQLMLKADQQTAANEPILLPLMHKDGSLLEVTMQTNLLALENQKLLMVVLQHLEENTPLHKTIQENQPHAQSLEQISELLIDNVPDLIFRLDKKGTYLDAGGKAEHLLYTAKDNFISKTMLEVLPESIAPAMTASLQKSFETQQIQHFEYELKIQNKNHYFENRIIPINDNEVLSIVRDLTEQKLIGQRLKDSDARWRFALEGNGNALWDWNIAENKTFFSSQWPELTGYSQQQMENVLSDWQSLIVAEDRQIVAAVIEDALKNPDKAFALDYRIETLQGEIKWLFGQVKVVEQNEKAEAVRMIGVVSDITARKKIELELSQQKQEIENFFELSLDLLAIITSDGHFIKANRCWSKVLNLPVKMLEGRRFLDFVHPDDVAEISERFKNITADGDAERFTCRFLTDSANTRYVEWNVSKHQDLIYAAATNVTDKIIAHNELVELNNRLSEKEQMLQMVLDLIPLRVFWKDKNLRYLGGNKRLLQDAQLTNVNDLIGKRDEELVWKKQAKFYQEHDRQVLESGNPKLGYEEFQENDALNKSWLRTSKVPIFDQSGQATGLLGIYEDITTRKQTEEALISNEAFLRKLLRALNKGLLLDNNKQLINHIVTDSRRIFKADECFFISWDAINQCGNIEIIQEPTEKSEQYINQTSANYFIEALMNDEQVIPINDASKSNFFSAEDSSKCAGKSLIGIPIIAGDDKIGALIVCYSSQKAFTINEIERANLASGIFSLLFGRNNYFSQIKENEQMLRLLIEKSPIGIATTNRDGYYVMCNAQIEKMFGYSEAELQKIHIKNIVDSDFFAQGQQHFEILNEEETSYVELKIKHADGSNFWCAVHAVKITDDLRLGFHIDITESIESKNALAHEKAMLNNLLQSMPDLVFYKDLEGKFLGGNHLLEKQLGKPIQEIIGKKDQDFLSAEISTENQKVNQQIIQTKKLIKLNESLVFPDQQQIPVETTKAPLYDQNNKIIGVLGTSRDISERIAYEKALKESDVLLKQLTINVPGIILQLERKADSTYHFPYVSKGIERIFEFPPEALEQNSNLIFEQVVDEDKEAFRQSIRDSFDSLEEWKSDFRIKLSDNRIKYLRGNAMPSIQDDKSLIWHGHIMDITLQHNIEQQLDEQQETINTIFRSLEEVIYSYNPKTGKLDFISPSCEQLLGYGSEQYRDGFDFHQKNIHPDDLPNILMQRENLISDGKGVIEYRFITKSGSLKWIMDKAKVILDADEKPIRVEGIMSDITDRKNFELALKASEERFDMAMKYTDSGLWDWDMVANKTFYTDTWKTMLGYQPHEISNEQDEWNSRWHPDDKETIEKTIADYLSGKTTRYFIEHRLRNKQGNWQWILARGALLRDKAGKPVRWLGTNIDITERKKLENDLQYRATLQDILMTMANQLINIDAEEIDKTINESLARVGRFVDADRAYILSYDLTAKVSSNTYEWCAEGISPQINKLQNVPIEVFSDWLDTHKAGNILIIEDVMALPNDDFTRALLEPQNVQSLITVPMIENKKLIGSIGFDSVKIKKTWTETEKELLLFMAELIVNAQSRQQFTATLKEQKNMLSMATEASQTAIYNWDLSTYQIRHNYEMSNILGFDVDNEPLNSLKYLSYIHPNDYQKTYDTITQIVENEIESFDIEYRIQHKDGTYIWIQDKGSVVETDIQGNAVKISGTRANISLRKNFELALAASEERFDMAMKYTDSGLWDWDMVANKTFYTDTWKTMLGYEPHEIGDGHDEWEKRWHPDDKQRIEAAISDYLKGRSARYSIEHRLLNKQGNWQWILTRGILMRNQDGKPVRWLGTNIDISDRKKLENDLQYRATLQNILMTMANNLINIDIEDVQKTIDDALEQVGRFVDADRAYIFSYDMEANNTSNIYEWCAEGITAEIENLQHVPLDFIPHWVNTHKAGKTMIIEDVMGLPEDDGVRVILEPQGVQSIITVPMIDHKNLIGFIGFDAVRKRKTYSETEKELLLFMAELILNAQTRQGYTQELEAQKNMLSLATEASETAVYSWDIEPNLIQHNFQMNNILGFDVSAIAIDGVQYLNYIHPIDYPIVVNKITDVFDGKTDKFDLEYRLKHKDNSYVWIHDKGSVVETNLKGKPQKISGARTNINRRKQIELELQQSERRFKSLYENAAIGLYRTTPAGEIIMVNPSMAKMLGYDDTEELKKINITESDFHLAPYRNDFLKRMNETGELRGYETEWRRKDGTLIQVRENSIVIKDEENNIVYFDGSVEDITQRKQALEALKHSEERFRQLAENIDDIIWLQEGRKMIYVNPAFERVTGYSTSLMLKNELNTIQLIYKEDLAAFKIAYDIFIQNPTESWIHELRYQHKSGQLRWLKINLHLLRDSIENKGRIIGVATDITEQKKVEEQLQINLKMERELGELKTRFVSMASHELRTPVATIMATTETLLAYYNKMNSEQLQQRLTKILDQSVFLKEMMNGVLDLSKIQQGKTVFNPKITDALAIVKEVVDEFQAHPNTQQKIVVNASDEQIQFELDTLMLRQTLYNLISNAIKYSPDDSEITVTLNKTANELLLAVADQGIGIPESEQIYLFDAFFRASNSTEIKGTGLGMPIVKESVDYHGGSIKVESTQNQGTTISCYFPDKTNLTT